MSGLPRARLAAAVLMASAAALGGPNANVAQATGPTSSVSKDMMPGEARQRAVQQMVLKKRRTRYSGDPRGDGFDDWRMERARAKRARKLARAGGWRR